MDPDARAPPNIEDLLELAAKAVLAWTTPDLFIEDLPVGPKFLSTVPVIELMKTGGTTGHQQQGGNYIAYTFAIPSVNISYSIYVTHASADPAVNQRALARAIRWFITHYCKGTTFTRDEPAT